jgi:hypothetical protein
MFKAENIVLTCSKSGKLSRSHVEYWRDNVLMQNVPKKSLLLSDSWSGQGDVKLYRKVPGCTRLEIPPWTTDQIQPLDRYFNRQLKYIIRRVYDRVMLDQLPISMRQRDNIIKLTSLAHNQMCSEAFESMIKFAWFSSGYTDNNPGFFRSVKQVCFSFTSTTCQKKDCLECPFIACSWCRRTLCFSHFFIQYH